MTTRGDDTRSDLVDWRDAFHAQSMNKDAVRPASAYGCTEMVGSSRDSTVLLRSIEPVGPCSKPVHRAVSESELLSGRHAPEPRQSASQRPAGQLSVSLGLIDA